MPLYHVTKVSFYYITKNKEYSMDGNMDIKFGRKNGSYDFKKKR